MRHIKLINETYDVSGIKKRILDDPSMWNMVSQMVEDDREKYRNGSCLSGIESSYLPLIMAVLDPKMEGIKNSDLVKPLPTLDLFEEVREFWFKYEFKTIARAAFFRLPPGGRVPLHTDIGQYYQTKDRYHLVIQGDYEYYTGDEMINAKEGMFFWFNNKRAHGTVNTGDVDRITLVFDTPHNPDNPHHKL